MKINDMILAVVQTQHRDSAVWCESEVKLFRTGWSKTVAWAVLLYGVNYDVRQERH
jgi:hypothetical protein